MMTVILSKLSLSLSTLSPFKFLKGSSLSAFKKWLPKVETHEFAIIILFQEEKIFKRERGAA